MSNMHPEGEIQQKLRMEDPSGRKGAVKRLALPVIVAIIVILVPIIWSTTNNAQSFQFKTGKAISGDLTITIGATGNLEPRNQVDVGSELSGIIRTVEVDYNDHVEKGQVLARLDTEKLQSEVNNSKAALESARAQVIQAQASLKAVKAEFERLKRVHELSGGKVPSKYDLESAQASFEKAEADLIRAKSQASQAGAVLESSQTDLSKAVICSPINGIVLGRTVEPGQTVAASLQAPVLFTLAEDLTRMELHVDVDEADVGQVGEGQDATFTVDAYPEQSFPAHITQVRYGATDTDGVITYETVLLVDNKDLLLRPGMTATADIVVSRVRDAVLIPNAALRFKPPESPGGSTEEKEEGTSVMSRIFPRPPRHNKAQSNNENARNSGGRQQVWRLEDGHTVPIDVTAGVTDGIMTQVISGGIEPGMELVVGIMSLKK